MNTQVNTRFILGPAIASFDPYITDTVVFPGGDADAKLCIEGNVSDAVAPYARMVLNPICYVKIQPLPSTPILSGISNVAANPSADLPSLLTTHTFVDEVTKEIKMQVRTNAGMKTVILGSYT